MASSSTGIRPSLERKLQEFLNRSKEFYAFRDLNHEFLVRTFTAGKSGKYNTFEEWRTQLAKEEQEKYKRERSTSI